MVKYFCDDCGAELTEYDNIAHQLDMTGHVYCHECIEKHSDLYKPVSWTSVTTKDKIERWKSLKQHVRE
jgi:DNA-directed RNA polymerase subunit RPC12/RpoP